MIKKQSHSEARQNLLTTGLKHLSASTYRIAHHAPRMHSPPIRERKTQPAAEHIYEQHVSRAKKRCVRLRRNATQRNAIGSSKR
jgi:hypothetical protein